MTLIRLPRKASNRYVISYPYRKPTLVVEERILRWTSDSWPRNSAKLPCNFGRKGASLIVARQKAGRSEKAQATVYQKHKALQNRKMKYKA
jgi:cob(I)alamin adenosyltransferase